MAWIWVEREPPFDGCWVWDKRDGPQEIDQRPISEQGRPGLLHGERVSNRGVRLLAKPGTELDDILIR